jgi:chromosomal replication initiator protein
METNNFDPLTVIENYIKEKFNLPDEGIQTNTRKRNICEPRQICMFIAVELFWRNPRKRIFSQTHIAKTFGGKDHATCNHANKKINDIMFSDFSFRKDIFEYKKDIENLLSPKCN